MSPEEGGGRWFGQLNCLARSVRCGLLVIAAIAIGYFYSFPARSMKGDGMPEITIEVVLKKHTKALMSLPGVVGTAQGLCEGRDCIKVFVRQRTPELEKLIPAALEGYKVSIEESGEIRTLPK